MSRGLPRLPRLLLVNYYEQCFLPLVCLFLWYLQEIFLEINVRSLDFIGKEPVVFELGFILFVRSFLWRFCLLIYMCLPIRIVLHHTFYRKMDLEKTMEIPIMSWTVPIFFIPNLLPEKMIPFVSTRCNTKTYYVFFVTGNWPHSLNSRTTE